MLDISVAFGKCELIISQLTLSNLFRPSVLDSGPRHRRRSAADMVLGRTGNHNGIPLVVRYVYGKCGRFPFYIAGNGMLRASYIGYHVPATRRRDLFYAKLEQERDQDSGTF